MDDTTFSSGTVIESAWLNAVNDRVYNQAAAMDVTATLTDDSAGYWSFGASTTGVAVIHSTEAASRGNALVVFRVGVASAYCQIMGSTGATVTGTAGPLADGSGTDGELTLSADTTTNRLYISNRTGNTGMYKLLPLWTDSTCTGFTSV